MVSDILSDNCVCSTLENRSVYLFAVGTSWPHDVRALTEYRGGACDDRVPPPRTHRPPVCEWSLHENARWVQRFKHSQLAMHRFFFTPLLGNLEIFIWAIDCHLPKCQWWVRLFLYNLHLYIVYSRVTSRYFHG